MSKLESKSEAQQRANAELRKRLKAIREDCEKKDQLMAGKNDRVEKLEKSLAAAENKLRSIQYLDHQFLFTETFTRAKKLCSKT